MAVAAGSWSHSTGKRCDGAAGLHPDARISSVLMLDLGRGVGDVFDDSGGYI